GQCPGAFRTMGAVDQLAPPVPAVTEADSDQMDLLLEIDLPGHALTTSRITNNPIEVDRFVAEIEVVVLDPGRPIIPQSKLYAGADRPAPAVIGTSERGVSAVR